MIAGHNRISGKLRQYIVNFMRDYVKMQGVNLNKIALRDAFVLYISLKWFWLTIKNEIYDNIILHY